MLQPSPAQGADLVVCATGARAQQGVEEVDRVEGSLGEGPRKAPAPSATSHAWSAWSAKEQRRV